MENMIIRPIAHIRTDFRDKFGIPRQSGRVPELTGKIVFEPEYRDPTALREIEGFSHIWLLFDFSAAHRKDWSPTVRPPRLGGNTRVGVFASRSPFRPNPIGLSCVKLLSVAQSAEEGTVLIVGGVDLLDNTPILDIKPYIPYTDCVPSASAGYTADTCTYALQVDFPQELLMKVPPSIREATVACLREDPRPSYQSDPDRVYGMRMGDVDIRFRVDGDRLTVIDVVSNSESYKGE